MSNIENWVEYKLGELLNYEQPTPYIVDSSDYNDNYVTPVLTAGKSFILGYTNEKSGIYVNVPVIIFDDFTTASKYVDFKFKVKSSAMKILTFNSKLAIPKFLFYKMQIIEFDHSTHKRYWIQHYSKLKISIPTISEQVSIVSHIDEMFSELDKAIETLQAINQQLAVYRQSVLKEAFSSDENTILHKISSFALVGTGATPLKTNSEYYGGNIPWITSTAVNQAYITKANDFITELALKKTNCKIFPQHSLVIAMYGEGKTRGMCSELMISAATNQAVAVIQLKDESFVIRQFLKWFLTMNYYELRRKSSGGVQPNMNLSSIKNYLVPIYSIDEQIKIVEKIETQLSVYDYIEQSVNTTLNQAEALRQSILKRAFEGKLL